MTHPMLVVAIQGKVGRVSMPANSSAPEKLSKTSFVRIVVRILGVIVALAASALALPLALAVLGAYFPRIPKIGVIGPVLTGQYPFHMALFAVVAGGLAVGAWALGWPRWGGTVTTVAVVTTVAALVVAGLQYADARRVWTVVSWHDMFSELGLPAAVPDSVETYAEPGGQALRVDVYLPEKRSGSTVPAIVLAHAGGFHTFDKEDLRGTGRWLADRGVAVFAIDYRLATREQPTWDRAPQDVACAVGWVQEHAGQYGVDSARVSLGGMSAGGTLAMNAGYRLSRGEIESSCGNAPKAPASVVGFYPGTDVTWMWNHNSQGTREAAELFTGGTPQQFPDRYRVVSPTSDIRQGLPRTLLVVGDRDTSAIPSTVTDFGAALDTAGVDNRVHVLPFAVHAFDDAYGSLSSQASRQLLFDFLVTDSPR
ncbi:alpha/beta hydrolase [Nocardia sp. NPDC052566]|uniref:alpha/beta hydrolase n=1 Tax=Nocardia sp. NPDC052566 TaxID=3364330 RepID=UPI0037CC9AA1